MNIKKPNHWILNNISKTEYRNALNIADSQLIYKTLKGFCDIDEGTSQTIGQKRELVNKIIEKLELALIELQSKYRDNNISKEEKEDFYRISQDLFILFRSLPMPKNSVEKIKYIYKLVSYAYLGQKWQDGRRFLIENKQECIVKIAEKDSWDIRLFKKIYLAFLYLIRKDNWKDLDRASELIVDLRKEQKIYEEKYINNSEPSSLKGKALELYGLYHLAKIIESTAEYMINGKPSRIREELSFHFDKAIKSANEIGNIEMNLTLDLLHSTLNQMISNSVWMVTQRVNSKVTEFISKLTKSNKPIFELLYPQKAAILEEGLLNPAHKAVVVNMPTSSGKTILAEFRILQALNQFSDINGWIAYVVPTRALVNQISRRLNNDLAKIGVKVEKMSGAIELDPFEKNIVEQKSNEDGDVFDVLVTTPEKLNLLIRDELGDEIKDKLVLTVLDEAHNLEDKTRGLNHELLLANIKNDCSRSNFLLLTPFISNSKEIAKWLDQDSPNDVSIAISWQPNDRIIGAIYPEGKARDWRTRYRTLLTSHERIQVKKDIIISEDTPIDETISSLSKRSITTAVTKQLENRKGILVIARTIDSCWNLADELSTHLDDIELDEDHKLVQKYISTELGDSFILKELINKGIGVHHAGLPDEIKYLMEWLMGKEKLKILISTTTIAQGINFPVSTILMASYSYPYTSHMPVKDFWNLVGRCGRTTQGTLGLVGIAVDQNTKKRKKDMDKLSRFINKSANELISKLKEIVEEAIETGAIMDLSILFREPRWSQFLQYIAHMYNQTKDINEFNKKADIFLRNTFGYNSLNRKSRDQLLKAVKKYGSKLDDNKGISSLSDSTGFSPETIRETLNKVSQLGLSANTWDKSNLFSDGENLVDLMGVMLTIPEIKDNLDVGTDSSPNGKTLANIISDWVNGNDLKSIAEEYFGGSDKKAITKSCKAIYKNIVNSATWGLSSIQKLPGVGIDFDELSEEEKLNIRNLPAMIYYGVNTDEAVLMRKNNVPRSIASELGNLYDNEENIYNSSSSKVNDWLDIDKKWEKASEDKNLSGKEYKRLWRILNGNQ